VPINLELSELLLMMTLANSTGLFDVFSIIMPDTFPCPCCWAERFVTLIHIMIKRLRSLIVEVMVLIIYYKFSNKRNI
jgi:disulfide bond formation protein DsbB